MAKFLLLAICAIYLINKGDCIECYSCGPSTDNCMDNKSNNCGVCLKTVSSGNNPMYRKSCVNVPPIGAKIGSCTNLGPLGSVCACNDSDLCNSAVKNWINLNTIFVTIAALAYYIYQ